MKRIYSVMLAITFLAFMCSCSSQPVIESSDILESETSETQVATDVSIETTSTSELVIEETTKIEEINETEETEETTEQATIALYDIYSTYSDVMNDNANDIIECELFSDITRDVGQTCSLFDFDCDGVEELFFMHSNADGFGYLSVYTVDDSYDAVKLFDDIGIGTPGQGSSWKVYVAGNNELYIISEFSNSGDIFHFGYSEGEFVCLELWEKYETEFDSGEFDYRGLSTPTKINDVWSNYTLDLNGISGEEYANVINEIDNSSYTLLLTNSKVDDSSSFAKSWIGVKAEMIGATGEDFVSEDRFNSVMAELQYEEYDGTYSLVNSNGTVCVYAEFIHDIDLIEICQTHTDELIVIDDDLNAYFACIKDNYSGYSFYVGNGESCIFISTYSGYEGVITSLLIPLFSITN